MTRVGALNNNDVFLQVIAECVNRRAPGRLLLSHEHDRPDGSEGPVEESSSVPERGGVVDRPQRRGDIRGDAGTDAGPGTSPSVGDLPRSKPADDRDDIERIAALVVAQITQHRHHHIHLPEQPPNADQLAELKAKAPEAYDLWIETTRKRADHDIWQSQKAVRQPYLLASLGQWLGLAAVLSVLVLADLAVYLDHPWVGGILGVIDVIGLAAVFNGNQWRRREPPQQGGQQRSPGRQ
jgi:hypothetical protein